MSKHVEYCVANFHNFFCESLQIVYNIGKDLLTLFWLNSFLLDWCVQTCPILQCYFPEFFIFLWKSWNSLCYSKGLCNSILIVIVFGCNWGVQACHVYSLVASFNIFLNLCHSPRIVLGMKRAPSSVVILEFFVCNCLVQVCGVVSF